ncbi:ATP-binding cassette domain-containing protein [Kutzneria viridogrisea]|uniref:Molybdenum import ATP-binding protein ModC n=2 Tax=Kutzneria TaxID=43356 RepID=W5VYF9_9PSEU|nr:ATP-binding cassette domain-containing protein [Kutzneria albida]AHH93938.1 Molybdenum import ATP-binding protein ModC [Kutzneria albida DSM 43870]MBA8931057.1 molybdate transport system ATP-binding protein [Kutzneria viridogrisea]
MSELSLDVTASRDKFSLELALDVRPGEVLAVLGGNGAGKSTLLSVLAGLLRPDRGRIELSGRVLNDTAKRVHLAPHRRGVGLLAQDPLLFPHMTVLANVAFGPTSRGTARRAALDAARHWLSEVDAAEFADRRPGQLSGGQAQRVAVARALAAEPELLLLDEPFAALDVDAAPALRAMLRRVLRGSRRTTLLVTHDPLDALVLADRVIVLAEGRLVEQGATRQVLGTPRTRFTARIAGLDLVAGTADPAGLRAPDGTLVTGLSQDPIPAGEPAVAVFAPASVAVHATRPHGSPRNVWPAVVAGLEPHGDVIRLRAVAAPGGPPWVDGLAADLTPASVADLALEPGGSVWLAVKATEVALHPVAGGS